MKKKLKSSSLFRDAFPGERGNGDRFTLVDTYRLTLELVTVGDFALPVAGLFVQVKGQSAGTRDLLQAGFRAPVRIGQKANGTPFNSIAIEMNRLLSSWSQFFTFVFQSHV